MTIGYLILLLCVPLVHCTSYQWTSTDSVGQWSARYEERDVHVLWYINMKCSRVITY